MKPNWTSDAQRELEWKVAKQYSVDEHGVKVPHATKIIDRKKTYKDQETGVDVKFTHSFIVLSGKIFVMGNKNNYLKRPERSSVGRVKYGVDEAGKLYALKIEEVTTKRSFIISEIGIAADLGIAHPGGTRVNHKSITKGYCPYEYLGEVNFEAFLRDRPFDTRTDDQDYSLAIQVARIVHDLHTGKYSKTHTKYSHRDLKPSNIIYDAGKLKLIDFGFTELLEGSEGSPYTLIGTPLYLPVDLDLKSYTKQCLDIFALFRILYLPERFKSLGDLFFQYTDREAEDSWIFSDRLVSTNKRLSDLLNKTNKKDELHKLSALDIARELTLMRCQLDDSCKVLLESEQAIDLANDLYSKQIPIKEEYLRHATQIWGKFINGAVYTESDLDKFIENETQINFTLWI